MTCGSRRLGRADDHGEGEEEEPRLAVIADEVVEPENRSDSD